MGKCSCPICSSILEYDESDFIVYCNMCGMTLPTQNLPSEKALSEQLKAHSEELEQQLEEACREKKAAEDRLDLILPNLEMITDAQYSTQQIVQEILSQARQQDDELAILSENQKELVTLILEIRGEQESTNGTIVSLSKLVQAIMVGQGTQAREITDLREMILSVSRTQGDFSDKLDLLSDISARLTDNQRLTRAEIADLRASLNGKLSKLQMSMDEQKEFNKYLESLLRTDHAKDSAAIEKIAQSMDGLSRSQQEIVDRLERCQADLDEYRNPLREEETLNQFVQQITSLLPSLLKAGSSGSAPAPANVPAVDISSVRETLASISGSTVYEKVSRISNFESAISALNTRMRTLDILSRAISNSADPDTVALKEQILAQRTAEGRKKIKAKEQMDRIIENCKQNLNSVKSQPVGSIDPTIASNIRETLRSCVRDIERTNQTNTPLDSECKALCKVWGVV